MDYKELHFCINLEVRVDEEFQKHNMKLEDNLTLH